MTQPVTLTAGQEEVVLGFLHLPELKHGRITSDEALQLASHVLGMAYQDDSSQLDPNEDRSVMLWAEIHKLRARAAGPEGTGTWYEAAIDERRRRSAVERELNALKTESSQEEKSSPNLTTNSAREDRIRQLMTDVGMPNSTSLYQSFKQFEMELMLSLGYDAWEKAKEPEDTFELEYLYDLARGYTREKFKTAFEAAVGRALNRQTAKHQVMVDAVYRERNQLFAALSKEFPAGRVKREIEGCAPEWCNFVYIDLPTGQISGAYHEREAHLFEHLPPYTQPWDGHTVEDVAHRLTTLDSSWTRVPDVAGEWEYETVEKPRKSGDIYPPDGEGWVKDYSRGRPGEAWDRFDNHEETYWKRRVKASAPAIEPLNIDVKAAIREELLGIRHFVRALENTKIYNDTDRGYNKAIGHVLERLNTQLKKYPEPLLPKAFRAVAPSVQAMQFLGTEADAQAIQRWTEVRVEFIAAHTAHSARLRVDLMELITLNMGDWLVRSENDPPTYLHFTNAEFSRLYQGAPQ